MTLVPKGMSAFLGFTFFADFALVYPVYVIFFQQQGLDYRQISWLLAVWSVAALISEIPAGVIADSWSRKGMLIIGMILKSLGFIVWMVRPDATGFAIGFILWGVQEGSSTGVSEAWLYDALAQDDQAESYVELAGRRGLYQRIAVALSVLFGGAVFSLSVSAVMIISAVSMGISAMCATLLPETRHRRSATRIASESYSEIQNTVVTALRVPGFIPLVLFAAFGLVTYGIMDEYDFIIGTSYGVPVIFIGLWGGFRFLLEGIGAAIAHRLHWLNPESHPGMIALWIGGAGILLVIVGLFQRAILIPFYFLFFLLMAAAEIIIDGWIQDRVSSQGRATVASVVSFVYEVMGLVLILLSGVLMYRGGLYALILAAGIAVCVAAIGIFWVFRKLTAPVERAE